jgi:hypothetical protein
MAAMAAGSSSTYNSRYKASAAHVCQQHYIVAAATTTAAAATAAALAMYVTDVGTTSDACLQLQHAIPLCRAEHTSSPTT